VRRALPAALVLLLALALAPGARAQSGGAEAGTPVVGGGSFTTAPLIGSGSYRDTLLPAERLFYGVELQAGQRLRVGAQLDRKAAESLEENTGGFSVGIQTPLREVDVLDLVDEDVTGNGTVTLGDSFDRIEFISVPVLAGSGAREESTTYRGPGTWFVSLYLSSTEQDPPRVEVPVELELEVIGEPQPETQPDPTPAEPTPPPGGEPDAGGDDGGPSPGALLGIGLGGLVVGLVGGGAAARAGRRR